MNAKMKRIFSLLCAVWMTLSVCADAFSAFPLFDRTEETAESGADGQVRILSAADASNSCQVTVSIGADAAIPENAELVVSEIRQEEERTAQNVEALGETEENVLFTKSLDISLVDPDTGQAFQPDKDVTVSIRLLDAEISPDAAVDVVSSGGAADADSQAELLDAQAVEVVESAADGDTVEFVTGDLSAVYTVVVTTRTQTLEASDGKAYKVTVTYDSASGIPEDAEVLVSEIRQDGDEYAEYVAQSVEALGREKSDVLFARAFDITLKNPVTGEEYQPDKNVKVSIELLDENLSDATSVNVVHFGEETETLDSAVKGEAVEFETSGFSVYVIIGHEGEAEIQTPRVEFHFLSEDYEDYKEDSDAPGVYHAPAYVFPNKAPATQTSQILRNGEALELVKNPENKTVDDPDNPGQKKEMYFFGWYIVQMSSVAEDGIVTYTWTADPEKMPFEQPVTLAKESGDATFQKGDTVRWTIGGVTGTGELDASGIAHVYLAPIYEDYYFITFHLGAKDDAALSSSIYVRKLVVLGSDESAKVRIGEVIAPASNPKQRVFAGWETVNSDNTRKDFFQTVDFNGKEVDENGAEGQFFQTFHKNDFSADLSVHLYPVFYEARWISFNPGSGASYVPSAYLLTSEAGQETSAQEGFSCNTLPVSERSGYAFDGWYADAAVDAAGNITNLENAQEMEIEYYYDAAAQLQTVTDSRKAVRITDGNGTVLPQTGGYTNSVSGFQRFSVDANGNLYVYKGLEELFLTAHWVPGEVNYTVLYWLENADDDDYSLIRYETKSGFAGERTAAVALSESSETYRKYDLKYCALSKDQDKSKVGEQGEIQQQTIAGNGSTIVNVYYDRNRYTIRFDVGFSYPSASGVKQGYSEISPAEAASYSGAVYGVIEGKSVTDGTLIELLRCAGTDGQSFFGYEDSANGAPYCLDGGVYKPLEISSSTEHKLYKPQYEYVIDNTGTTDIYGFTNGAYVPLEVQDQTTSETVTVYKLTTGSLTNGKEYLIANVNAAGSGYVLGHTENTSQKVSVTVQSPTSQIDSAYIPESDALASSKWTVSAVSNGYRFKNRINNQDYYLNPDSSLKIQTNANNNAWTWSNAKLFYNNNNYLRYSPSNQNFTVQTYDKNHVSLYEKTTVQVETTTLSYVYNGQSYDTETRYQRREYDGDDMYRVSALTELNGTLYYHDTEGKYGVAGQYVPVVEAGSETEYAYSYQGAAFSGDVFLISPYAGRLYKEVTTTGNIYCISSITNSTNYNDYLTQVGNNSTAHSIGRAFVPGEYQSTRTEKKNSVTYTVYYADLTAKYGENIADRWPATQSDKEGNYGFIGWVLRQDSYYWNKVANSSLKGVYETMDEAIICVGSAPYTATTAENGGVAHEFRCRYETNVHKYVYRAYFWRPENPGDGYSATPIETEVNSAGDPEHRAVTPYTGYDCVLVKFVQSNENGNEVDITDVTGKDYSYSAYSVSSVGYDAMIIKFWYQPHKWTITFNQGNNVLHTDEYYYDQSIADADKYAEDMAASAPEGHTFVGWYDNAEGLGSQFVFTSDSKMPDNNLILYAIYQPVEYRVKIDPNGGEIDHINHNYTAATGYNNISGLSVFNRAAIDGERNADHGYDTSRSTYFNADYKETVGEYALERRYVPLSDAMAAAYAADGGTVYYYLNAQYSDEEGILPKDCRNALYLTEDEIHQYYQFYYDLTQYTKETNAKYADTVILGENAWRSKYVSSQKYRAAYNGEHYQFLGWYQVTTDSAGKETVGNMPYVFSTEVTKELTLRAYWRLDTGFRIEYEPQFAMPDGTLINGDLMQWKDPAVEGATYTDGAKTQILQQPTRLTANGQNTEEYIFRGWRLVSMKKVNGLPVYTPMESGVYYDPGDPFTVEAALADRDGMIYFQAVYEEKDSSYRRPFVAALTLDANGGYVTEDGTTNPASGKQDLEWNDNKAYLDYEEEKLVFGFEDKPDWFQSNNTIRLYQYATDLEYPNGETVYKTVDGNQVEDESKKLDPVGKNYFRQNDGDFLLGFDDVKNEGDYIADYTADAVISAPRRDEKTIYAVWEPMVYLNIVNDTENNDAHIDGGPLTFSLTTSEHSDALYVVNERTGLFDRVPVSDISNIVVGVGKTLRLALPKAEGDTVTLNSVNNLGSGTLVYWESWIGTPETTTGNPGSASYRDAIKADETLVRDKDGITIVFRTKKADKVLILDDNYTGGRQSEVYFCERNDGNIPGIHILSEPYTLNTQSTRLGYQCVGWSETAGAVAGDTGFYEIPHTFDNMTTFFGDNAQVTLYAIWSVNGEASTVYVYKNVPVPDGRSGEFAFAREKEFEFTLHCSITYQVPSASSGSLEGSQTYTLKHNQYLIIKTEKYVATSDKDAYLTATVTRYTEGSDSPETLEPLGLVWSDTRGTTDGSFDSQFMSVTEGDYTSDYVTTVEAEAIPGGGNLTASGRAVSWSNTEVGGTVIFTNEPKTVDVTLKKVLKGQEAKGFLFGVSYVPAGETTAVTRSDVSVNSGSEKTVEKIPKGATLTIAEKGSNLLNYVTTATVDGAEQMIVTTPGTDGGETTKAVEFEVKENTEVTFTNTLKSVPVKIVKVGSDGTTTYTDVEATFAMERDGSSLFKNRTTKPVSSSNPRGNIVFETGVTYPTTGTDPRLSPGDYTLKETALLNPNYVKLYDALTIRIAGAKAESAGLDGVSVEVLNVGEKVATVTQDGGVYLITVFNRRSADITVQVGLQDPLENQQTFSYSGSYTLDGATFQIDPFTLTAYRTDDGTPHAENETKTLSIPIGATALTITQTNNAAYATHQIQNGETHNDNVYTHDGEFTESAVVTFKNTRKAVAVTVKKAKGSGDVTGTFAFAATLKKGETKIAYGEFNNNGNMDFSLAVGGEKKITIPVGADLTVQEKDADSYATTIAVELESGGEYTGSSSTNTTQKLVSLENVNTPLTVTFTNGANDKEISFTKIDGFGEPLDGAKFSLYDTYAKASAGGSDSLPIDITCVSGTVTFKAASGVYYMKETQEPDGYEKNPYVYRVAIGEKGSTVEGVGTLPADSEFLIQRMSDASNVDSIPDIAKYGILNVSKNKRKVILRKVGENVGIYASLEGAQFDILRYDMTKVNDVALTSGANGVFWIGELPDGQYYLHETGVPAGYARISEEEGNWFKFTVNDDGVSSPTPCSPP